MFCKNCGAKLNENVKYCSNCGSLVEFNNNDNGNFNNINNNANINNNFTQNNYMDNNQTNNVMDFDERFIKSYIGNKADKMYDSVKKGGFNIWAILFGIGYFAYRKMYLVSIIIVIVGDIIGYLIPPINNYIGPIIGLMFCPLYKWDITRKLRKIKNDNPNADENQLLLLAQKKGGTSVIGAIAFFIIYFLIIFFIYLILLFIIFRGM